MKNRLFTSILCGTAVLSAAVVFSGCGRAQINASDYVTIKFNGYDNYGTATATIDREQMLQDNKEGFGLKDADEMSQLQVEVKLEDSIDGKLDKTSELKNGDTVTFSWKNSGIENLEKNYKVKFTFEDKTATVEGLEEAQDYDPFADIKVEFKGFDGMGVVQNGYFSADGGIGIELDMTKNGKLKNGDTIKASIKGDVNGIKKNLLTQGKNLTKTEETYTVSGLEPIKDVDLFEYITVNFEGTSPNAKAIVKQKDSAPVKYLNYNVSKTDGLANGDVIKVTLEGDYSGEGVKATSTEKEYTVEGLPYYITELKQLPADVSEKMQNNDNDIFNARVASNWNDDEEFKGMKFIGNYFIKPKEGADFGWNSHYENKVYFVYKVTAANPKDGTFSYYWASSYNDIMVLDDGTCSFNLNDASYTSTINEHYNPGGNSYYYNGFKDLDSLFSNLITSKIDKYTYENTVKEESAKTEKSSDDSEKKSSKKKTDKEEE